jgi:ribonuclease HII
MNNKSTVLFTATAQLIKYAYDNFDDDQLQIVIDRQGGRERYQPHLQRIFPEMELTILKETPKNSSYELKGKDKTMRLHFVVGADDKYLPVSLASMASKYLRELLVNNINLFFRAHCADIKPTAGYWQDGTRFIKDLKENIPHVEYDPNQLIRCR